MHILLLDEPKWWRISENSVESIMILESPHNTRCLESAIKLSHDLEGLEEAARNDHRSFLIPRAKFIREASTIVSGSETNSVCNCVRGTPTPECQET